MHSVQSRGVAELLLRAGADAQARDNNGLTAHEERRAFGVRGLAEVADFIENWNGAKDLVPREVETILQQARGSDLAGVRDVSSAGVSHPRLSPRAGAIVAPVQIRGRTDDTMSPDVFHSRDMLNRTPPTSPQAGSCERRETLSLPSRTASPSKRSPPPPPAAVQQNAERRNASRLDDRSPRAIAAVDAGRRPVETTTRSEEDISRPAAAVVSPDSSGWVLKSSLSAMQGGDL